MQEKSALYIHIPFCEKKCFYCSFVVSVGQERRMDSYIECLEKESRPYKGQKVHSIYFGGGTPTFLSAVQLENLLGMTVRVFDVEPGAEWTVEANPEHIDKQKLGVLKKHGVNRISLGIQTFQEPYLRFLGRNHTRAKAVESYQLIRQAGFHSVNVDLMFGFPKQTMKQLREDLRDMIGLQSDHVSLYALTIEERSRFFAEGMKLPQDELVGGFYTQIKNVLENAGLHQYEVSNFARQGRESKHNINYWKGGSYIGLGIGAHSHIDGRRWWNISRLTEYIQAVEEGRSVEEDHEELNVKQRLMERVLFGLRMNEGIDLQDAQDSIQHSLDEGQRRTIENFVQEGLLMRQGSHLKASERGRLVLDEICAQLI